MILLRNNSNVINKFLLFQVEISMENIETVVKERNKAYWLLETGENRDERPSGEVIDTFGK